MKTFAWPVIMLLLISVVVKSEESENEWDTIKKLMSDYNSAKSIEDNELAAKKYTAYLDSLSVEQLMDAGRACSRELNESFLAYGFSEGVGFVISFFPRYYSKKTQMKNLEPILADIHDPNQTEMWRSTLIHAFREGVWINELTIEQLQILTDTFNEILNREVNSYPILKESIYTTRSLLYRMEDEVMSPPADSGEMNDSLTIPYGQKVADNYSRFSERLLNVFFESNSNPELQEISLALTIGLLDKPISTKAHIEDVLTHAICNFRDYRESIWKQFLRFGKKNLETKATEELERAMRLELEQRYNTESNKEKKRDLYFELEGIKRESIRLGITNYK